MAEAIAIAAVLYVILFTLALNLRFVPEPAEDEWASALIFVGRRKKSRILFAFEASLLSSAALTYALWAGATTQAEREMKFSPSASGPSAHIGYVLLEGGPFSILETTLD